MDSVVCCFCGLLVDSTIAVHMSLSFAEPSDEGQELYSHAACLRARLHPTIPIHPALEDIAGD
jgi:hypothetical protein